MVVMEREWKPGDVAMVRRYPTTDEHPAMFTLDGGWVCYHGIDCETPHDARPLVVIDPGDRAQAQRLVLAMRAHAPEPLADWEVELLGDDRDLIETTDALQAALRELANPAPPKPAEPTGLGAVVEDAEGKRYVRTADTDCRLPWSYANNYSDFDWDMVNAVRVLSEGVQ